MKRFFSLKLAIISFTALSSLNLKGMDNEDQKQQLLESAGNLALSVKDLLESCKFQPQELPKKPNKLKITKQFPLKQHQSIINELNTKVSQGILKNRPTKLKISKQLPGKQNPVKINNQSNNTNQGVLKDEVKRQKTSMQLQAMLYRAIINDSHEQVTQALKEGSRLDLIMRHELYPISFAIYLTKSKAVKAMLEHIATNLNELFSYINAWHGPNSVFGNGGYVSIIGYACTMGDLKTVLALVEHGVDFRRGYESRSIFDHVLDYIDEDLEIGLKVLQALIDAKLPEYDWEGKKQFVPNGYNINDNSACINGWACAISVRPHTGEVIESINYVLSLLLKNGADVNQNILWSGRPVTPLMLAVSYNNVDAVKFLINAGADKNKTGHMGKGPETPLAYAIRDQKESPNNRPQERSEIIQILQK